MLAADPFRFQEAWVRILRSSRYALGSCVAAAMLTGCGGSQPPISVPGAMAVA